MRSHARSPAAPPLASPHCDNSSASHPAIRAGCNSHSGSSSTRNTLSHPATPTAGLHRSETCPGTSPLSMPPIAANIPLPPSSVQAGPAGSGFDCRSGSLSARTASPHCSALSALSSPAAPLETTGFAQRTSQRLPSPHPPTRSEDFSPPGVPEPAPVPLPDLLSTSVLANSHAYASEGSISPPLCIGTPFQRNRCSRHQPNSENTRLIHIENCWQIA